MPKKSALPPGMVMLSAEVPESLRRRLNGIAGNQGIAAKDIVTEALEQWLSLGAEKNIDSSVTNDQNKSLIIPQQLFGELAQQLASTISRSIREVMREELKAFSTGPGSHESSNTAAKALASAEKARIARDSARNLGVPKSSRRSKGSGLKRA